MLPVVVPSRDMHDNTEYSLTAAYLTEGRETPLKDLAGAALPLGDHGILIASHYYGCYEEDMP